MRVAQTKLATKTAAFSKQLGNIAKAAGALVVSDGTGESSGKSYDISEIAGDKKSWEQVQTYGDRISKTFGTNGEAGFKAALGLAAGCGIKSISAFLDAHAKLGASLAFNANSRDEELASIANDMRESKVKDRLTQATDRDTYSDNNTSSDQFSKNHQCRNRSS